MTIYTLILYIAIAALVLTGLTAVAYKGKKNWLMTYLQHFCGSLFIFSGYVKAVDPLGTAFKMEQYFAEFIYTFKETAFSFLSPMFSWFSEHSIVFSVFMIVFEIVLGVMLVLGSRPKLTSWLFFLMVLFFTFLTGFTYLTGYVPSDVNFFEFGKWGPYVETNMKVTDCGCFGDFLKLKPKISFYKDVFLLLPAIYFLFRHRDMHRLFNSKIRALLIALTAIGFLVFSIRNFVWDEPIFDFRPFKAGTDVRTQKEYESEQSTIASEVTAYKMTNKSTGQVVTLPVDQYMKEFKNYPKEEWELEQVKENPPFEVSKISEFEISGPDGEDVAEALLAEPGYTFMVNAYKLKMLDGKEKHITTVVDTIFKIDTVRVANSDSFTLVKSVVETKPKEITTEVSTFEDDYVKLYTNILNPVLAAAEKEGHKVFAVTAPNDPAILEDFRHASQSAYPFYTADDLLLKTIQRSNPGLVLWKDGKIIQKWHIRKLPGYEEIKAQYMQ